MFLTEDAAKNFLADLENSDPNGTRFEIVGGKGTYFKITNSDGLKYNITALNTTGKYNDDLTLNRGDLSFDLVTIKKYTFTINPTEEPTPPPPSDNPAPSPVNPNRFMLVGQQTCLNEATYNEGNYTSTGRTLNRYSSHTEQINNVPGYVFRDVYGAPYNENSNDLYNYTYFPLVYDKYMKLESSSKRVSIKVKDEGIYIVGCAVGRLVNDWVEHSGRKLEPVSYLSQNPQYAQEFACNFLCIKNNFVIIRESEWTSSGNDPIVKYTGSAGIDFVPIRFVNDVTFYVITNSKRVLDDQTFTIPAGYYKLPDGAKLTDKTLWLNDNGTVKSERILSAEEQALYAAGDLYSTIEGYLNSGEIHSGSNETGHNDVGKVDVMMVNHNGRYIHNSANSGHSDNDGWTPNFSDRSNHSIFFSPNYPITHGGTYHWYCGGNFNFQWFRNSSTPLDVTNNSRVRISASRIILTFGSLSGGVSTSNELKGAADSEWTLHGPGEAGAPDDLYVMTDIAVTYAGGSYTIKHGIYPDVPAGINLFSDAGKQFFTVDCEIRSLDNYNDIVKYPSEVTPEDPTASTETPSTANVALNASTSNSAVMPASVSANTARTLSLFTRTRNALALAPMNPYLIQDTHTDGVEYLSEVETGQHRVMLADYSLENLYYKDDDLTDNIHHVKVNQSLTLQRKLSSTESYDYIVFVGDGNRAFEIPKCGTEDKIDLFDPDEIIRRVDSMEGENFTYSVTTEEERKVLKKYY